MIEAFFVAFGTVFLAELPDKTMVASLVLTTRFRRPLAVWVGVSSAFVLHVVLAVSIGSLLRRLPETPVKVAVATLFLVGGWLLLRGDSEPAEDAADVPADVSFRRVALTAASVVGLAEFGDLTQLATAGIATRYSAPIAVALGAWCALASVAALAVTAGQWIVRHVPLRVVQRVAGGVFLVFGIVTLVSIFTDTRVPRVCRRRCRGTVQAMNDKPDQPDQYLVGVSLPDALRAQEFLTAATGLSVKGSLKLRDAVIVSKDDNGNTAVRETIDPQPGRTALSSAMWSGLLGLMFGGPVGWLVGGAVGAGIGAGAAKIIDLGVPDEWVQWFRESVQPSTTTVVLLLENLDVGALATELQRFPFARLVHTTLPEYSLRRLEAALGQSPATPVAEAPAEPAAAATEPADS